MSELERQIKSYLKQNLSIEIREETPVLENYKIIHVELFVEDELITSDNISVPKD